MELDKRKHMSVVQTGKWLRSVIQGYFNYHAVPGKLKILSGFKREIGLMWLKSLRRRSQRSRMTWERFSKLWALFCPIMLTIMDRPVVVHGVAYERCNWI